MKSAASSKINLARLPPTTEAAQHHALRVYHQVQKWIGLEKDPSDYGWAFGEKGLMPIRMLADPAPQSLLRMLSCKCKKGCTGACTCLKAGLKCSILCTFCKGKTCMNVPPIMIEEEDEDDDDPLEISVSHAPPQQSHDVPPPTTPTRDPCWDEPGPSKRTRF